MADRGPLGRAAGPGAEVRSTDDGASSDKQTRSEAQNMGQAALDMKRLPGREKTRQHWGERANVFSRQTHLWGQNVAWARPRPPSVHLHGLYTEHDRGGRIKTPAGAWKGTF